MVKRIMFNQLFVFVTFHIDKRGANNISE